MDWLTTPGFAHIPIPANASFPEIWHIYSGQRTNTTLFVWLHGWGQSYQSFIPLIKQCDEVGDHLAIDFPGFGKSRLPENVSNTPWGTKEYAKHIHPLIQHYAQSYKQIIFVGHSFGCRVSLQYAHYFPEELDGVVFLGGAGLKRNLSILKKLRRSAIRHALALGKRIDTLFPTRFADAIRDCYGSADYKSAGVLRPILSKVVNEDLSPLAKELKVPALLLYGELDDQTPPEFGQRFHEMMPQSELHIFRGFDHYTILNQAKYQVFSVLQVWINRLSNSATD